MKRNSGKQLAGEAHQDEHLPFKLAAEGSNPSTGTNPFQDWGFWAISLVPFLFAGISYLMYGEIR